MQNRKVRPIRDFVLIQPVPEDEKTKGGLFIPRTAKVKELRGTVLAVGPGRMLECGKRVEPEVKVGDEVLCMEFNLAQSNGFTDVGRGELAEKIVPEGDIIAVIEP
jgi:chaperonin GroES